MKIVDNNEIREFLLSQPLTKNKRIKYEKYKNLRTYILDLAYYDLSN